MMHDVTLIHCNNLLDMCAILLLYYMLLYYYSLFERYHSSRLQLTSSRSTRYETLGSESSSGHASYFPRKILDISELGSLSASQVPYKEFDMVGLVAHLSMTSYPPRHTEDSDSVLDVICLADMSGILLVKAWGGVKVISLRQVFCHLLC